MLWALAPGTSRLGPATIAIVDRSACRAVRAVAAGGRRCGGCRGRAPVVVPCPATLLPPRSPAASSSSQTAVVVSTVLTPEKRHKKDGRTG